MKERQLKKVSMHYRFPNGDGWNEYKQRVAAAADCIKSDYPAMLEIQAEPFEKYEHKGFDIEMKEKEPHALDAPLKDFFESAGSPHCVYWGSDYECVQRALPPGKMLKGKWSTGYVLAKLVVDAE